MGEEQEVAPLKFSAHLGCSCSWKTHLPFYISPSLRSGSLAGCFHMGCVEGVRMYPCLMIGKVCLLSALLQASGERWGGCRHCFTMCIHVLEKDGRQSCMRTGRYEDNAWGGLFQSQIQGESIPVLTALSLIQQSHHTQLFYASSTDMGTACSTGLQQDWVLMRMWRCWQSGPCCFFCSGVAHLPLLLQRVQ